MSDLFLSQLSATLSTDAQLSAQLSAGAMIINDWIIEMTEIPGGHRLTARRGAEVQSMDIMDGAEGPQGANGDTGPQGPAGTNGKDGAPGYTPVRGTDYWTAADKAQMVSDVLAALPVYNGEVADV